MFAKTYIFSLSYLLLTGTAWSQLAVYGDLYVRKNNQLHIAFNETYFNGGKIITDNTSVSEALKNSSFIQTKYTGTPPYLFTQLNADFEIPLYHYWSWKTQGEAIGRIRVTNFDNPL